MSGTAIGLWSSGGAYFSNGFKGSNSSYYGILGGIGAKNGSYVGGDGGTAGSGGKIYIEGNLNRIYAYNGSYITDSGSTINQTDSWKQENQSIIYAQVGYSLEDLRADINSETTYPVVSEITSRTAIDLIGELGNNYRTIDYTIYNLYGKMGIGSGAGCIEVSNGTLTVNNTSN